MLSSVYAAWHGMGQGGQVCASLTEQVGFRQENGNSSMLFTTADMTNKR